jgi:hypothetical protein
MRPIVLRSAVGTAAVVLFATPASAQQAWMDHSQPRAFWATVQRPSWEGEGLSTWSFELGGRLRFGARSSLILEVPVLMNSVEGGLAEDGTEIGNPYIGFRAGVGGGQVELGLRPPFVGNDVPQVTVFTAVLTDYYRFEAFAPEVWTARGAVSMDRVQPGGLRYRIGLAPHVMIPKEGDVEVFLNYEAGGGFEMPTFGVLVVFHGRWLATEEGGDFGERSAHEIVLSGTYKGTRIRPTAFVRMPLDDDIKDALKMVLGVGISVGF